MTAVAEREDLRAAMVQLEAAVDAGGWDGAPLLITIHESQTRGEDGEPAALICADMPGFDVALSHTEHPREAMKTLALACRASKAYNPETRVMFLPDLVALVLVTEAWMIVGKLPDHLPDSELDAAVEAWRATRPAPSRYPDRVEARQVVVVGADGSVAVLSRTRGEDPSWYQYGEPGKVTEPQGAIVDLQRELLGAICELVST